MVKSSGGDNCTFFRSSVPFRMLFAMFTLFRRSRAMALALVLLAPGIAGTAVQWLHACPAEAAAAADHHQHDSGSSQTGHSQGCECVGSCNPPGVLAPAKAPVLSALDQPHHRAILPIDLPFVPGGIPSDFLPPATAPPLS